MTQAQQIQEDAYREFDQWLSRQSNDVKELDILEQIDVYATAPTQVGAA